MSVSINRFLRRSRRRLLLVASLLFICFAVVSAHSAFGGGQMDHDGQMAGALAVCLAIGETAAAMFVAAALGRLAVRPARLTALPATLEGTPRLFGVPQGTKARAGPELQVFLT
ncbi:hypothetical protein [Paraconexibacter algicola]|uniref:Uncharacterized protein n=1 Tax=Paraconexibacter algicola TaxID=2133960 RepID=A0A2T4UM36_9ACTN|nr:hypothetical protein [Paraconexibacter algicola]PTL60289.1 hypothetical protein C7Y72_11890 [Paraconexibacter algicola]